MTGCVDVDEPRSATVAVFNPTDGEIPVPNDLLFSDSLDGTTNIPAELDAQGNPLPVPEPRKSLSTVDGASTVAPILVNFSRAIDESSLVAGSSVRMFEVSTSVTPPAPPVGGPVTAIDNELTGADFSVSVVEEFGNAAIQIQPLAPLTPSRVNPSNGALENSVYMVVLTDAITDADGFGVTRDVTYNLAAQAGLFDPATTDSSLVDLQELVVNPQLLAYTAATGNDRSEVICSFTFTTESVGAGLSSVITIANGGEATLITNLCAALQTCGGDTAPSPFSTQTVRVAPLAPVIGTVADLTGPNLTSGNADIYVGSFESPYYLTAAANPTFDQVTLDSAPLTETWRTRYAAPGEFFAIPDEADRDNNVTRFNSLPLASKAEIMPLLLSVPGAAVGAPPASGWPVVIFAPGIFQSRLNMLFVADAFADKGFAVICIDLPLHGVNANAFGSTNPDGSVNSNGGLLLNGANIFVGFNDQSGGPRERTFGMDFLNNTTGAPGPDGVADTSGAHFVNLANLAVTRDNLQQAVADYANLRAALGGLNVVNAGGDVFDEDSVHFVGHSLGAIIGMPYVTLDDANLKASTLAMGGGAIPYLLESSLAFGATIQDGLTAAGVPPGSPLYYQFLQTAQTVIDTTDAINFTDLGATGPLFAMEVIGGGPEGGLPDLVVPNQATGNLLGGTEPFIQQAGLASISSTTTVPGGQRAAVRYIEGSHSSLLLPTIDGQSPASSNALAYPEMQEAMTDFHVTDGATVTVTNPAVVQ
jgi:pimeloyl-ACP methyl ester carboxylesterase